MNLSREASPDEDGVATAEEATEATEDEEEGHGAEPSQPGIYTEHVFTDPLGAQPRTQLNHRHTSQVRTAAVKQSWATKWARWMSA